MRVLVLSVLTTALALGGQSPAVADGLAQLKSFHATTKSGKVAFRQVVVGKGQQGARESTGTFAFQRPGKFRWTYETPYEQLLVGDGEKLWVYDRDLNQVTVRKLDRALGSTPAALLAGDSALEQNFDLADGGKGDGIDYVDAKPRSPDTGFERVRIGLANDLPRTMELRDSFGNVTTLTFGTFERATRRRNRDCSDSSRRRVPTSSARPGSHAGPYGRRGGGSARPGNPGRDRIRPAARVLRAANGPPPARLIFWPRVHRPVPISL
jgi:outer membrane lipoprotein carrier protein